MAEKAEVLSETRHANIERNWQVEHVLIRIPDFDRFAGK
jgi:hypothetical protein